MLVGHHPTLQSGLPHIRTPTQRDRGGQGNRTCGGGGHLFPAFAPFLSTSLSLLWRRWGVAVVVGGTWVSSFFHPVLPGAVQFLDPPPSGSSRLLLSISCSSLLPPRRSRSSLLRSETSKPATLQHVHSKTDSHILPGNSRPPLSKKLRTHSESGKRGQQDAELCRCSSADAVVEALG